MVNGPANIHYNAYETKALKANITPILGYTVAGVSGISANNGHLALSNFLPNGDTNTLTVELRNTNSYTVDALGGFIALIWYINDALIS